jgi:hypothetical protein
MKTKLKARHLPKYDKNQFSKIYFRPNRLQYQLLRPKAISKMLILLTGIKMAAIIGFNVP